MVEKEKSIPAKEEMMAEVNGESKLRNTSPIPVPKTPSAKEEPVAGTPWKNVEPKEEKVAVHTQSSPPVAEDTAIPTINGPNLFVRTGHWFRDVFYGKWLVGIGDYVEPRIVTWMVWFVHMCGLMLFVTIILGIYALFQIGTFFGFLGTLFILIWIGYVGHKQLGVIFYKALSSTINVLESLKTKIDEKENGKN